MQIILAVVPILLILGLVVLVLATAVNLRKNPGVAALLALITMVFTTVVVCCLIGILRSA